MCNSSETKALNAFIIILTIFSLSSVPKTILVLEDSLELIEFRKAIMLIFTIYYSQRTQIKLKGKGTRDEV